MSSTSPPTKKSTSKPLRKPIFKFAKQSVKPELERNDTTKVIANLEHGEKLDEITEETKKETIIDTPSFISRETDTEGSKIDEKTVTESYVSTSFEKPTTSQMPEATEETSPVLYQQEVMDNDSKPVIKMKKQVRPPKFAFTRPRKPVEKPEQEILKNVEEVTESVGTFLTLQKQSDSVILSEVDNVGTSEKAEQSIVLETTKISKNPKKVPKFAFTRQKLEDKKMKEDSQVEASTSTSSNNKTPENLEKNVKKTVKVPVFAFKNRKPIVKHTVKDDVGSDNIELQKRSNSPTSVEPALESINSSSSPISAIPPYRINTQVFSRMFGRHLNSSILTQKKVETVKTGPDLIQESDSSSSSETDNEEVPEASFNITDDEMRMYEDAMVEDAGELGENNHPETSESEKQKNEESEEDVTAVTSCHDTESETEVCEDKDLDSASKKNDVRLSRTPLATSRFVSKLHRRKVCSYREVVKVNASQVMNNATPWNAYEPLQNPKPKSYYDSGLKDGKFGSASEIIDKMYPNGSDPTTGALKSFPGTNMEILLEDHKFFMNQSAQKKIFERLNIAADFSSFLYNKDAKRHSRFNPNKQEWLTYSTCEEFARKLGKKVALSKDSLAMTSSECELVLPCMKMRKISDNLFRPVLIDGYSIHHIFDKTRYPNFHSLCISTISKLRPLCIRLLLDVLLNYISDGRKATVYLPEIFCPSSTSFEALTRKKEHVVDDIWAYKVLIEFGMINFIKATSLDSFTETLLQLAIERQAILIREKQQAYDSREENFITAPMFIKYNPDVNSFLSVFLKPVVNECYREEKIIDENEEYNPMWYYPPGSDPKVNGGPNREQQLEQQLSLGDQVRNICAILRCGDFGLESYKLWKIKLILAIVLKYGKKKEEFMLEEFKEKRMADIEKWITFIEQNGTVPEDLPNSFFPVDSRFSC